MAYLQHAEIRYYKNETDPLDEGLLVGYLLHWLEDNFDPTCNDTWNVLTLRDEYVTAALEAFDADVDGKFVCKYLDGMRDEVEKMDKQGVDIADYAKFFMNSIRVENVCAGGTVTDASGVEDDEVAPGTFCEWCIDELVKAAEEATGKPLH